MQVNILLSVITTKHWIICRWKKKKLYWDFLCSMKFVRSVKCLKSPLSKYANLAAKIFNYWLQATLLYKKDVWMKASESASSWVREESNSLWLAWDLLLQALIQVFMWIGVSAWRLLPATLWVTLLTPLFLGIKFHFSVLCIWMWMQFWPVDL